MNCKYNIYSVQQYTNPTLINYVFVFIFVPLLGLKLGMHYYNYMYIIPYSIGVEIGTLPNEQHQISGTLHVLDSNTLYIEDFNYDGGGPGEAVY